MKYLLLSLLSLELLSCASSPQYFRSPTEKQILKFRTDSDHLTNRACASYDASQVCAQYEVIEYDLDNPQIRKALRDLDFICKIAGKRYKIDEDSAQFRRDQYYGCGFLKLKKCRKSEYIGLDQIDYLRQAGTRCFNQKVYDFDSF